MGFGPTQTFQYPLVHHPAPPPPQNKSTAAQHADDGDENDNEGNDGYDNIDGDEEDDDDDNDDDDTNDDSSDDDRAIWKKVAARGPCSPNIFRPTNLDKLAPTSNIGPTSVSAFSGKFGVLFWGGWCL